MYTELKKTKLFRNNYLFYILLFFLFTPLLSCSTALNPATTNQDNDIATKFLSEKDHTKRPLPIHLRNRKITITNSSTKDTIKYLEKAKTENVHLIMQAKASLTQKQKQFLKAKGLKVLSPINNHAYYASMNKSFPINDKYVKELVYGLIAIESRDKINKNLLTIEQASKSYTIKRPNKKKVINYVVNKDGTLNLTVQFYKGTDIKHIKKVLNIYSNKYEQLSDEFWKVKLKYADLEKLANKETVKWIDAAPIPFLPENDNTRHILNIDEIQAFNVGTATYGGLAGQNIDIGIFDAGVDSAGHNDFTTTLIDNTANTFWSFHGTHVAGIALGNGSQSNQNDNFGNNNGGNAFQWRGMAPLSDLIDAPSTDSRDTSEVQSYINTNGMDVSNHSYSISYDGEYNADNILLDQIIRGDATFNGNPIPPRLMVFSAGNNGERTQWGGEQIGYYSNTKQVKNAIVVGNYDGVENRISTTSSLGPAYDGRIKPDVVAPGENIMSTGYCDNNADPACRNPATGNPPRQNFYEVHSGTSMAAPVVTGTISLILEQWSTKFGVNIDTNPPLPSTLRGMVIHSARDISSPLMFDNEDGPVLAFMGPDYVTGWGMVDPVKALSTFDTHEIVENSVNETCDKKEYRFYIKPNRDTPLKVTIAWDDVEAVAAAARSTTPLLVNDLDLHLIDPKGTIHYPWVLNQRAFNSLNNPIPPYLQTCGTNIRVETEMQPVANPNFIAIGDPANVNDNLTLNELQPARFGKDHLNNVEVVSTQPTGGWWTAVVTGFDIVDGPQDFSIIYPESEYVPPTPVTPKPTGFNARKFKLNRVLLSWDSMTNIDNFEITRTSGTNTRTWTVAGTGTLFITEQPICFSYSYKIRAVRNNVKSAPAGPVYLRILDPSCPF